MKRVLITGYEGLLGHHVHGAIHALNATAEFSGKERPFELRLAGRVEFASFESLIPLLDGCDVVLHFAGINRGTDQEVGAGNRSITNTLIDALRATGSRAHVVFSNSTHIDRDTLYGAIKRETAARLGAWALETGGTFSDLVLPHLFGENGKPFYNTVTATLCQQIADGVEPQINPEGEVELIHAGEVADHILALLAGGRQGQERIEGRRITVKALYDKLKKQYDDYCNNTMPELSDRFTLLLFNTLRSYLYPAFYPRKLYIHSDNRGDLFETVRGGGGGQTFLSWTQAGVTRGNHFHRYKVERFVVVSGEAIIRIRRIFSDEVSEFRVSGKEPSFIDMPALHTHSIENIGDEPLLTQFWAHEVFDPERPDTYADPVLL